VPDITQRVKILVVDDEPLLAESLAENLRDSVHHYDASWVHSGKRALEFLEKQPVDVVISDIKMADTSGLDLLYKIRMKHPTVRVILMTGYGLPDIEEEALRRGSLFYLEKPFEIRQLEIAIERVLQRDAAAEAKAAEPAPALPKEPRAKKPRAEDRGPKIEDRKTSGDRAASMLDAPSSILHPPSSLPVAPPPVVEPATPLQSAPIPGPASTVTGQDQATRDKGQRTRDLIPESQQPKAEIDQEQIDALRRDVLNPSDLIDGGALVEEDNTVVVSSLASKTGPAQATSASQLLAASRTALAVFGRGEHRQSLIQGDHGNTILIQAGPRRFLLFLTDSQVNLGLLLVRIRQRAERAAAILPAGTEERGSKIEDRKSGYDQVAPSLHPPSSILHPQSSGPLAPEQIELLLHEVLHPADWTEGGALIGEGCRLIASNLSHFAEGGGQDFIAAASQLLNAGGAALTALGQGNHRQSFIQGEQGNLIITQVTPTEFLLFLTNSQANLGPALVQIRKRAQRAAELVK
jgi:predicted regulator of Ras-like GTPase activity (Roadblock/LC7/MglB family)/DNA-binding NarL/FixJ family response regulator